jgi:hypothetical protein
MSGPLKNTSGRIVFRFCGGTRVSQSGQSDNPQAAKEAQAFWAETWRETTSRRFDDAAANMPTPAALLTADNHPVLHPLTIRLLNGSSLDIDRDDWPTLVSPARTMHDLGQHATEHLFVGKYADGRTLVYVVIDQPDVENTIVGEMLPAGSADVEAAVRRVAERFAISTRLVDQCLDSIKR